VLSNIGGNKYQETPLNVFSVSSRKGKVFLDATGCLLYSSWV